MLYFHRQEVWLIRWKTLILATFSSLFYSCQPVAAFISLATLVATGGELTSYNIFIILSVISRLRVTISWNIAYSVKCLADFAAALARIQDALEFGDFHSQASLQLSFMEEKTGDLNGKKRHSRRNVHMAHALKREDRIEQQLHKNQIQPQISLQSVACSWNSNFKNPTLQSLCLSLYKGDLVFVIGPVGCGKTSLLFTILGELPLHQGLVSFRGKIAYVGQKPWVFFGTVKENILFGKAIDPHRYNMILEACDLKKDIRKFPNGDETLVGECGTILSGGQKARVGLARAVYSDADVYLLDDPLSAVDSTVGQHIFKICINNVLGDKTRLMVTHNLQFLENADHIVVMHEGSILEHGNYHGLLKRGFDFENVVGSPTASVSIMDTRLNGKDRMVEEMMNNKTFGSEMVEEDRMIGFVSWRLYWDYLRAGMCVASAVVLATFLVTVQGWLSLFFSSVFL